MVVLHEYSVNVGETQSMHPANGVIMIADSPSPVVTSFNDNDVIINNKNENNNNMSAKAVLICRPNSHSFQERKLCLHQPVKVGRSVARARPASNNAIFDCKVLSRNHAVIWYEAGKFYIKDTKSSNGTFINNHRLSKGTEESLAREIYSGDIVQFGVDVMENSRKVAHCCIVASLKLYLPDGKEAKASHSTDVVSDSVIGMQELSQLSQCLQEAIHREQILENKLATLQRIVTSTKDSSDSSWKALIDEDRLLTRLELLENQVQAYSKNFTEDKLRDELTNLQSDKLTYQKSAKESLRKVLQEKLEAVRKHQELEASLSNAEDECAHLHRVCDETRKELDVLSKKNTSLSKEISSLNLKIEEKESSHKEVLELLEKEKQSLKEKIDELNMNKDAMSLRLEFLQADNDFTKEQLASIRAKISTFKKDEVELNRNEINDYKTLSGAITSENNQDCCGALRHALECGLEDLLNQISENKSELKNIKLNKNNKQEQLDVQEKNSNETFDHIEFLNDKLSDCQSEDDSLEQLINRLLTQIQDLKKELVNSSPKICTDSNEDDKEEIDSKKELEVEETHKISVETEISKLEELLAETRTKKKELEIEIEKYKEEITLEKEKVSLSVEMTKELEAEVDQPEDESNVTYDDINRLKDKLSNVETAAKEVRNQFANLNSRLDIEKESVIYKQNQIAQLIGDLKNETVALQKSNATIIQLNSQLQDSQQCAKQSHNEAELLRGKIKTLEEEVDRLSLKSQESEDNNENVGENLSLKKECSDMQSEISQLKNELLRKSEENQSMSSNYKKLEEQYSKLNIMKERLESMGSGYWKDEMKKIEEQYKLCNSQLTEAQEEIFTLKKTYHDSQKTKSDYEFELKSLREDVKNFSLQAQIVSFCAIGPLLILFVAVIAAFLPFWSTVTATQDKPS